MNDARSAEFALKQLDRSFEMCCPHSLRLTFPTRLHKRVRIVARGMLVFRTSHNEMPPSFVSMSEMAMFRQRCDSSASVPVQEEIEHCYSSTRNTDNGDGQPGFRVVPERGVRQSPPESDAQHVNSPKAEETCVNRE